MSPTSKRAWIILAFLSLRVVSVRAGELDVSIENPWAIKIGPSHYEAMNLVFPEQMRDSYPTLLDPARLHFGASLLMALHVFTGVGQKDIARDNRIPGRAHPLILASAAGRLFITRAARSETEPHLVLELPLAMGPRKIWALSPELFSGLQGLLSGVGAESQEEFARVVFDGELRETVPMSARFQEQVLEDWDSGDERHWYDRYAAVHWSRADALSEKERLRRAVARPFAGTAQKRHILAAYNGYFDEFQENRRGPVNRAVAQFLAFLFMDARFRRTGPGPRLATILGVSPAPARGADVPRAALDSKRGVLVMFDALYLAQPWSAAESLRSTLNWKDLQRRAEEWRRQSKAAFQYLDFLIPWNDLAREGLLY